MSDRTNPHLNSKEDAAQAALHAFLDAGVVSTAPKGQSAPQHHVSVQESNAPVESPLPVLPSVHGDYYVPPAGLPVAVAPSGGGAYAVTNAVVPRTADAPTIDPGERILSHPISSSTIKFDKDGTLKVQSEADVVVNGGSGGATVEVRSGGDVVINGGSKGAIHDIDTTTDADGHVTSISLQRRSDILI